jgi:hypothetical protein
MHIGYNKEWVKGMSLEEFKSHQKHHAKDTDLDADYIANGGKPKKAAKEPDKKGV